MATPEFGAEERTPRKVLLIDEDPKTARLVRTLLSGTGYSLLPSTRHAEGLRLATRHQSVLILTEVYFEKTDGPALAEKLLARHGGKLAFLTADESLLARFRRILMGAVDFLSKGDDVAQLRQRLRGILSSTLPLPVPI